MVSSKNRTVLFPNCILASDVELCCIYKKEKGVRILWERVTFGAIWGTDALTHTSWEGTNKMSKNSAKIMKYESHLLMCKRLANPV